MATRTPRRIRRPGHLALDVPDMSRALDFYTRVINLTRVEEVGGVVYLRSQYEHHCLELHPAGTAAHRHFGWETDSDDETAALEATVRQMGIPIRKAESEPGRLGHTFQFQDHLGLWHEVYCAMGRLGVLVPQGPIPPLRLGHFTRSTPDVDAALAFFRSIGFRVSDWLPGNQAFLRCGTEHHGVAFLKFERALFHHHAYDVGNWKGIKFVLDWLAKQDWPVEVGPVRHAAGNNIALYIRDPNGVRVEFFCEMEIIEDDEDHDTRRQPLRFDLWQQKPPPPGFRD